MMDSGILIKVADLIRELCSEALPVGEQIRQLRKARQFTQQALAARLNRGSTWVSDAENGHIPDATRMEDIEAVARALNIHPVEKARLIDAYICHLLKHLGK